MKPLSLIETVFFLKKIKPFSNLDLDLLLAVGDKLHHDEYDDGEKIFSCHQAANRMYLIAQGTIELIDAQRRSIATLSGGDYFGDESLFNEQSRSYGAICKTDALLFTLSRHHLLAVISECPAVAVSLLEGYAQQLPCRFIKPLF